MIGFHDVDERNLPIEIIITQIQYEKQIRVCLTDGLNSMMWLDSVILYILMMLIRLK